MNNENPTTVSTAEENSLIKPTKYSNWLIGILGALCVALAIVNMSKTSAIRALKQEVDVAQKSADQQSYENGYLQAVWDAYFEEPRYVIDDSKKEPVLWKQMPLDADTKARVAAFKAEVDRELEEGPANN